MQYYVLSEEQSGELHYWIWPADSAEQLIHKFSNAYYTSGQTIINFAKLIPGVSEPDWFKRRGQEEQMNLFDDLEAS